MIREKRIAAGMTQEDLASKIGVGRTTITMIENNKSKPSIKIARLIARELGIRWYDLFEKADSEVGEV